MTSLIHRQWEQMREDAREDAAAVIATWTPKPTKNYGSNILIALKGMRDNGTSFRLCGIEFGMTRNQVAGLCWRQGLCTPKPLIRIEPTRNPFPDVGGCLWANGDPRDGFCGEPAAPHSSYCETHQKRSLIRVKKDPQESIRNTG